MLHVSFCVLALRVARRSPGLVEEVDGHLELVERLLPVALKLPYLHSAIAIARNLSDNDLEET